MNLGELRSRLAEWAFGDVIARRVQLAAKETDERWWRQIGGAVGPQDRPWGERYQNVADVLAAWRDNPLVRRIVSLTTDYVVGDGIVLTSTVPGVQDYLLRWWSHPQNVMAQRLYGWCDELTRVGEIFLVLSTNPGDGLTYVRSVPASRIDQIETDRDDFEQELRYHELVDGSLEGQWWPSPRSPRSQSDLADACMVHYAVNKAVGAVRGEGDLTPILLWVRRYREWLEDRVRSNRLKNAFVWQVKIEQASPDDVQKKREQYRNPPAPGSIIVSDGNESWQALSAPLQGGEAAEDGKALRLLIAAGAGVPLHFLSEGESATRATAAEMGGPTFRHYRHRQLAFSGMLLDLAGVCVRRAMALGKLAACEDLGLSCVLPDLARPDDQAMAQALKSAVEGLQLLVAAGWLDDARAAAIAARFYGGDHDGGQ